MKQKLFENIGGNTFKLITEGVDEVNPQAKLVREGLKKVFGAGSRQLSYKKLQGVGLGYIKSVEEAKKTAIQEARELAKEYGYVDNENAQAFVKNESHAEPAVEPKKRTVQLAEEILKRTQYLQFDMDKPLVSEINKLVSEIIVLNEK